MAVESTFHKTHCGKPFNKAFCAQRAIRLHQVPKTRDGGLIPLSTGGFRGYPPMFLGASMCVLMGIYAFRTRFQSFWPQSFARKDISCHVRNRMLDKIVFRQSRFFYFFFLQHVSLTLFHLCPPQVLESTSSTDPWWSLKELCFRKDILSLFNYM